MLGLRISEPEWIGGVRILSLLSYIPVLPCLHCPKQFMRVKRYSLKPTRKYELTDHLNNVRVVIADQRIPVPDSSGQFVTYYKPKVVGIYDYYPYGWVKVRTVAYSFGANGGSLLEGWDSAGSTYYTPFRILGSRIGRWWQVDPMWDSLTGWSGYVVNVSNPAVHVDPEGGIPLDIIPDVIFVLYDVAEIVYQYVTEGEVDPVSVAALMADLGALAIPYMTGAGLVVRASARAGRMVSRISMGELARVLKEARVERLVIREGKEGAGVIVIGETMERVEKVAKALGAETFDVVKAYAEKYGISVEDAMKEIKKKGAEFWKEGGEAYQLNKEWIEQKMKEGKTIIDIGTDPNRQNRSIFYQMEREATKNYGVKQEYEIKD